MYKYNRTEATTRYISVCGKLYWSISTPYSATIDSEMHAKINSKYSRMKFLILPLYCGFISKYFIFVHSRIFLLLMIILPNLEWHESFPKVKIEKPHLISRVTSRCSGLIIWPRYPRHYSWCIDGDWLGLPAVGWFTAAISSWHSI